VSPDATGLTIRSLRDYAERKFQRNGVDLRGGSKILAIGEDWLELEGTGRGTDKIVNR
jgi:hypothetical protein